ncbi:MAG: radical SAM protein [Pseudomonadota bacterium]
MMLTKIKDFLRKRPRLFNMLRAGKIFLHEMVPALVQKDKYRINRALCLISARCGFGRSLGRPMLLNIEPTTVCDQKCTICETGLGILGRKPEYMSLGAFQNILDQFDSNMREILLYFMGETFLNKEAYKMIRYAADKGIYVSTCTNGNFVTPLELVQSGIAEINFHIAGTTQEIHEIYRVGGTLKAVLDATREAVLLRNEMRDALKRNPYPMKISLGFILFKHNEHQVPEVEGLAKDLGVDSFHIIDPCVRNVEQAHDLLPTDRDHWVYDPQAYERGELRMRRPPQNECEWLYSAMTIQVNGNVVPCCRDPKGLDVLGNALQENVNDIWNNPKFKRLRKQVATIQGSLQLCSLCEGYVMPVERKHLP